MAIYRNLAAMFTDIADAIREVDGTAGEISASSFASRIRDLSATSGLVPYGKLIGYYKFDKGSQSGTDREWLLNSASGTFSDGKFCQKLEDQIKINSGESFEFVIDQEADVSTGWPTNHNDLHMTTNKGMDLSYTGSEDMDYSVTGVVLDAIPTTRNFTISFTLNMDSDNGDKTNVSELFYIGPLSGSADTGNYCRAFRPNSGSSNRFRISQDIDSKNLVSDINSVFSSNVSTCQITLVFRSGMLTTFFNGEVGYQNDGDLGINDGISVDLPSSEDIRIIFDGIADNYTGRGIYVDEIYVFDCALNNAQVKTLILYPQSSDFGNSDGPN